MHLVYLCNNVDFLRLMLAKLPQPFNMMTVVVNERNKFMLPEMGVLLKASKQKTWVLRTDGEFIERYSYLQYVREHPLAIKFILPFCIPQPFLYMDDDCVICSPVPTGLYYSVCVLDRPKVSEHHLRLYDRVCEIFGDTTFQTYQNQRTEAGIWSINLDENAYYIYFKQWSETAWFYELDGNKFRTLGQTFLSAVFRTRPEMRKLLPTEYCALPFKFDSTARRLPKKRCFIHYVATSHKMKYCQWLMEVLP